MSERYDADELEERNSALTRELELKTREIASAYGDHQAGGHWEPEKASTRCLLCESDSYRIERDQLKARIVELEARPVSSPPARRGPRSPAAIWGSSALEPEAGETEDALGVPGLTGDQADRFMSGGAA